MLKKTMKTEANRSFSDWARTRYRFLVKRLKSLNGDPHFIAMGMAIGVFVSFTPTIPFHTVLAIALAYVFSGSKAAAAIGVWVSNPVTVPFFYYASYKVGCLVLWKRIPFNVKYESISMLLRLGMDVTLVMMLGGIVLGIIPGIATYIVTRKIVESIRAKKQSAKEKITP